VERLVPSRVRILIAAVAACLALATVPAEGRGRSAARPKRSASPAGKTASVPKKPASAPKKPASAPKKPAPPPEPDPLAGTWPRDGRDAWLGNGRLESEVVVSALRLVGLKNSFDGDSFARHVLYVNDLARKDALPRDRWSEALARRLRDGGVLKPGRTPKRGDLAFFGGSRGGPILAGVVASVGPDGFRFVAPVDGRVQEGFASRSAKKAGKRDTILAECGGQAPAAPAKKGRSRAKKAAPRACRAGELLLGTADIRGVAKILD
jgi:hypothetical protein